MSTAQIAGPFIIKGMLSSSGLPWRISRFKFLLRHSYYVGRYYNTVGRSGDRATGSKIAARCPLINLINCIRNLSLRGIAFVSVLFCYSGHTEE
jgi:hypothetical protein